MPVAISYMLAPAKQYMPLSTLNTSFIEESLSEVYFRDFFKIFEAS